MDKLLSTDFLVAIVGLSQETLGRFDGTTTETKDQVKGGFLLNVVIGQGAAILQLLPSKNKTLLVGRNALLVLNLGFDIINGVGGLHLEGDCLARQCLHKDLHPDRTRKHTETVKIACPGQVQTGHTPVRESQDPKGSMKRA